MPIKRTKPKKTGVPGVYKDGPRRFLVRTWWTDPRTGKQRKREGVATSLAEAVVLKETLRQPAAKRKRTRPRFGAYAEQWLEERAEVLALSTRERYIGSLAHLTAHFGDYWVDALAPGDIRRWRDRQAKQYARPTVNGWLRVLRQCLEDAVEDGVLPGNPARSVKVLSERRTKGKRGTALSVVEFGRFLTTVAILTESGELAEDIARMLLTLAWTGMRRGELLALRWDDIVEDELGIERAVYRGAEKATKTDDPRVVAIAPPLTEVLNAQRQWLVRTQHPGLESGLVFPARLQQAKGAASRRGSDELVWFRGGATLDRPLAKVVEKGKLPAISLHSFRRTWENLLRRAGVDQLVRRSLAGWRTEDAQDIYAGVDKGERQAAVASMVALVEEQNQHPAPTPGQNHVERRKR